MVEPVEGCDEIDVGRVGRTGDHEAASLARNDGVERWNMHCRLQQAQAERPFGFVVGKGGLIGNGDQVVVTEVVSDEGEVGRGTGARRSAMNRHGDRVGVGRELAYERRIKRPLGRNLYQQVGAETLQAVANPLRVSAAVAGHIDHDNLVSEKAQAVCNL